MTIVLKDNGKRSLEFSEERLRGFLNKRTNITDERFIKRLCGTIGNKESIKAEEITQLIIDLGLENVDIDQPEWSNEVAKVYLRKLYKEASRNRSYGADESYGSYYGLLKTLGAKGIYNSDILMKYSKEEIKQASEFINPENDLLFDYTGLYLLSTRYLATGFNEEVYELPQERFLTIAMTLMQDETEERLEKVKESYWALSNLYMTVATPTLTNAGKVGGQLSSCFIDTVDDSLDSIYNTNTDVATLSKYGGGIGVYIGKVRSKGSDIRGYAGASSGVIPWIN